jgi:hypothetical protein
MSYTNFVGLCAIDFTSYSYVMLEGEGGPDSVLDPDSLIPHPDPTF